MPLSVEGKAPITLPDSPGALTKRAAAPDHGGRLHANLRRVPGARAPRRTLRLVSLARNRAPDLAALRRLARRRSPLALRAGLVPHRERDHLSALHGCSRGMTSPGLPARPRRPERATHVGV